MFGFGITEEKIHRWQEAKNVGKLAKATNSKEDNLRKAAAIALLNVAEPEALQVTESLLSDPNDEIQTLVVQGFQRLHHEPSTEAGRMVMAFMLRDRNAILAMGEHAYSYLANALKNLTTDSASFAADILEEGNWEPETAEDNTYFLLALQKFDDLSSIWSPNLPVIAEYCSKQTDVALRRRAIMAVLSIDSGEVSSRDLEQFATDTDPEISRLVRSKIQEIERTEFVKRHTDTWQSFFRDPQSQCTEKTATEFIRTGMGYLEHGLLYEAYCALALADYIYEKLTGGYVIKEGIPIGNLATQREREIKVFGDFKLENVLKQISEKIRGKRETGSIISMILAGAPQGTDFNADHLTLKQILSSTQIQDTAFVDATVDFLIAHENKSLRIWRAIVNLPEKRFVPSLVGAFQYGDLVFDPVQALVYIHEEALTELLGALQHKNNKFRSNAAFALGMIGGAKALTALTETLQTETEPIVQVSLHFALARSGQKDGHVEYLLEHLEDENHALRRHAAFCIRNLTSGIDGSRLSKYIDHPDEMTRLFIMLTIMNTKEVLPNDILQCVVDRFLAEENDAVLGKLSEGFSQLKGNEMLNRLFLERLPTATTRQKIGIVSILGNINARESIDTLLALWPQANIDLKRSLLWSFGQLGALQSLDHLSQSLKFTKELRRVAALGLMLLSDADAQAAKKALESVPYTEAKMALALLKDDVAINRICQGLGPHNEIQEIFESLDAAAIVRDAKFIKPLYELLEYAHVNYYPTDRYVRHGAVEALTKTILTRC